MAWRLLTHLSERDAVEYCLYEIPSKDHLADSGHRDEESRGHEIDENTPLVAQTWDRPQKAARRRLDRAGSTRRYQLLQSISRLTQSFADDDDDEEEDDPTAPFVTLNALEIAAVADAKRFLGQTVVQKIITGIWNGDIIFWDNLSVNTVKKPRFYNPKTADPFSRLRVPKYLKSFEVIFFGTFLCLYYAVLVERNPYQISTIEVMLYFWFAAFFYDELSEWIDAGSIFYATDVWNLFDVVMITIGILFGFLSESPLCYGPGCVLTLARGCRAYLRRCSAHRLRVRCSVSGGTVHGPPCLFHPEPQPVLGSECNRLVPEPRCSRR